MHSFAQKHKYVVHGWQGRRNMNDPRRVTCSDAFLPFGLQETINKTKNASKWTCNAIGGHGATGKGREGKGSQGSEVIRNERRKGAVKERKMQTSSEEERR